MKRRKFLSTTGLLTGGLLISRSGFGFPDMNAVRHVLQTGDNDEMLWEEVRKYFLYPENLCYLNTAGNGALPENILEKISEAVLMILMIC